jgi:3-methyladenine DNA glycosylase AlkC
VLETSQYVDAREEPTMPTDSAKGAGKKAAAESTDEPTAESNVQHELLAALKRSQEATIKVVSAWSESVKKLAPTLPDMPKLPHLDSLPTPGELSDQFFAFAKEMMVAEQDFVQRLLDVLPGHDKKAD